jgi:Transposase, Mutator family
MNGKFVVRSHSYGECIYLRMKVAEWQNRPLEPMCPLVFFDALRVKIRDEGLVADPRPARPQVLAELHEDRLWDPRPRDLSRGSPRECSQFTASGKWSNPIFTRRG